MPRPVHFEIQAVDPQRLQDFYGAVFGWTFQKWGDVDYWVIATGDEEAGINGGLYPGADPGSPAGGRVNFVVGVDNCQTYYDRSIAAGATEVQGVEHTPGLGTLASLLDPEGNPYGLIEPEMP